MARRVFFSFHFKNDAWRASQVRNMGVVEGDKPISDNDWETVKKGGDKAIEKWIEDQLAGKSCTIVLVGSETSKRPWIKHEIKRSWVLGKGLLGICIHNLKDQDGNKSSKGANPFDEFTIDGKPMSNYVTLYDPPYQDSQMVYDHIKSNIGTWTEKAITARNG